tara:strand:- start:280 stop:828 length:549 start_codon:yes stop_codon:yes gene_type:complete
MGLKDDLMNAKLEALKKSGASEKSLNEAKKIGSPMEVQSEMEKEAIVNFLTNAEFRITKLNAPVVVEELKTSDLSVNIELDTLLGEYQPVLKTLRQLGDPLGLGQVIDSLEGEIKKAVTPLLEGGAKLPFQIGKAVGGLQSKAYASIGEDPDSVENFNVEDEDGQKEYTTVKLIREDIEDLL